MTICDKINEVGETLQEKLNDRGVDCTFGVGTGESTVLDMVEMVNGTNFKGSSDVNLKIGANRPYLLTGETTDVVVKLENGLCEPLKNKNVIVGQSVFRDGGTINDYTNWSSSNSSTSLTRLNDYSELKRKENASTFAWITKRLSVTDGITIEFDLKQATLPSSNKTYFTFRATGGSVKLGVYKTYENLADGQWHHYRFDVNGLTVTPTIDGVQRDDLPLSDNFNYVQLDASEEAVHHFKNFVVYENINGVTDEKGEFALYNVSVTDDTIFNATYGTEPATCIVEYYQFADYGITSKHNDNWYNQNSSFTVTRTDNATNLKITSPSSYQAYFSGGSGSWSSTKLYTAPFNVEFEITEITTGTPNFEIRGDNTYFTWTCSQIGSYRVEITGTKVRKYFNGAMESEYDRTMNEVYAIGFRQNASTEFKYKNFAIYTVTYGTGTVSCLVEYCDFVDYAVTTNKNNTWFNNTGGIITVDDSGTTFTSVPHPNGTHWTCGYCPSSTTSRNPFSYPIVVEFDIIHWTNRASIWIKSDLGNRTSFSSDLNHIGSRARIEIGTTSTKIYIDGTLVSTKTYTQPSTYGIELGYYVNKNDFPTAPSLKFANLSIRPL